MLRSEVQWEVPMCVSLPNEILNQELVFSMLDTTLAGLGIEKSAVKERVVWVDATRTRVRKKSGKLKEKEVVVLEVRVKAQQPGNPQTQEILYSTESHTDRSYCRSSGAVQPWKLTQPENDYHPVELTFAMDLELQPKWMKTEEKWEVTYMQRNREGKDQITILQGWEQLVFHLPFPWEPGTEIVDLSQPLLPTSGGRKVYTCRLRFT